MAQAQCTVFVVDVMERVAHNTDGPEPSYETAETWLDKHEDAITEAMEIAAREYIRAHWEAR